MLAGEGRRMIQSITLTKYTNDSLRYNITEFPEQISQSLSISSSFIFDITKRLI